MTAAIFVVSGLALWSASAGRREIAITLFAVALVASALWLDHHMTERLNLTF